MAGKLIALYNLEPIMINAAMMAVSQYHKQEGDTVQRYAPAFHAEYDKIYAFSMFDFTSKIHVRSDMIVGGTGFDKMIRLPPEMEACDCDYSIYPDCDTSYIWFTRGCYRKCEFCVVWEKEGGIHSVTPKNLNEKGVDIHLVDNSFFGGPQWKKDVETLLDWGLPVHFCSGIDVRIMNKHQGRALRKIKENIGFKKQKQLPIAWDNPKDTYIPERIKILKKYVNPKNIICYVLIGFYPWVTEEMDLYRIETLRSLNIDPCIMPFDRKDPYQMAMLNWVNHKPRFYTLTWEQWKRSLLEKGGMTKFRQKDYDTGRSRKRAKVGTRYKKRSKIK